MKKIISLLLCLALLLSLPFSSSADVETNSSMDELIAKACAAFPEYANKIRNQPINPQSVQTCTANDVVLSDSRDISDSETLYYDEYGDGSILLTSVQHTCQALIDVSGDDTPTSTSTTGWHYTLSIEAGMANTTSVYNWSDIHITIADGYDRITNIGTISKKGDCLAPSLTGKRLVETASKFAYVCYHLVFRIDPRPGYIKAVDFSVSVGGDAINVDHTCYD